MSDHDNDDFEIDEVANSLILLDPAKFGLYPRDIETYMALSMKSYFIDMPQWKRIEKMRVLYPVVAVKPYPRTASDVAIFDDHDMMNHAARDAEDKVQTDLEYKKDMRWAHISPYEDYEDMIRMDDEDDEDDDDDEDVIDMDYLTELASEAVQKAYEQFDPEHMSENLKRYFKQMYIIVMSGPSV